MPDNRTPSGQPYSDEEPDDLGGNFNADDFPDLWGSDADEAEPESDDSLYAELYARLSPEDGAPSSGSPSTGRPLDSGDDLAGNTDTSYAPFDESMFDDVGFNATSFDAGTSDDSAFDATSFDATTHTP